MIEESKCCSDVMKKHFNKELVMTKEDNEDFKNSINVRSAINIILILMLMILMENIKALHMEMVIFILN